MLKIAYELRDILKIDDAVTPLTGSFFDQTPDFVYHKSNGSIFKGSEAAWKQIDQDYAPFAQHKHDPTFLLAWETSQGWEMMGEVNFFFNLPAPLPEIETDSEGKKWQGVGFGAYHFIYAKDGDGLKLKFTRIYSDPTPVMRLMLNSNLVSAEQVASMLRA